MCREFSCGKQFEDFHSIPNGEAEKTKRSWDTTGGFRANSTPVFWKTYLPPEATNRTWFVFRQFLEPVHEAFVSLPRITHFAAMPQFSGVHLFDQVTAGVQFTQRPELGFLEFRRNNSCDVCER